MRLEQTDYSTIDYPQLYRGSSNRKKPVTRLAKFFLSLVFVGLIIIIISGLSLKLAIGPIIKKVDGLPGNFPAELAFYQLEQASITVQDQTSRQKIIRLIDKMPNWLIQPLIKRLSPQLQERLEQIFGDNLTKTAPTSEELKQFLTSGQLDRLTSVSLSWSDLEKTKEELTSYYKEKLNTAGFRLEEKIEDYEINLGFWKNDIFGNISLQDQPQNLYQSDVNMTINYFSPESSWQ
ncbi:MAG TPA: hypothetical protein PKL09_02645 [bacterium]|nr:hypothetical protein [bacterium]HNS34214.1 hypothetical protein [bacterium]HQA63865.1 hypothetical protein [bacterium]